MRTRRYYSHIYSAYALASPKGVDLFAGRRSSARPICLLDQPCPSRNHLPCIAAMCCSLSWGSGRQTSSFRAASEPPAKHCRSRHSALLQFRRDEGGSFKVKGVHPALTASAAASEGEFPPTVRDFAGNGPVGDEGQVCIVRHQPAAASTIRGTSRKLPPRAVEISRQAWLLTSATVPGGCAARTTWKSCARDRPPRGHRRHPRDQHEPRLTTATSAVTPSATSAATAPPPRRRREARAREEHQHVVPPLPIEGSSRMTSPTTSHTATSRAFRFDFRRPRVRE